MNIDELEAAARRAWPALEEVDSELGLLRFAAGVSRRANSLTPSPAGLHNHARVQELAEYWFRSRGLAPVVRVVGTGQPEQLALDRALDAAGYQRDALTAVLTRPLPKRQPDGIGRGQPVVTANWLQVWYQLRGLAPEDLPVHQAMLERITDSCCPLVINAGNATPVASALGVLSNGLLGVFGVATAVHARRQGLAASLVNQLCVWAAEQGARSAYLQVETGNVPAMNLYRSLGFRPAYQYWFRVGPLPVRRNPRPGNLYDSKQHHEEQHEYH